MHPYYSKGKVMLTGEYLVLKGAYSLALASRLGQHMQVHEDRLWKGEPILIWQAVDKHNNIWFEVDYELPGFRIIRTNDTGKALFLADILMKASTMNPDFLRWPLKYRVECVLEFERHWGLGSSSTLINNIAQWAKVDAFELFRHNSEGSGYDIAVADAGRHIVYRLQNQLPDFRITKWSPPFADELFFVALGNKQWSEKAVRNFRDTHVSETTISEINAITLSIEQATDLKTFEDLLGQHERVVAKVLGQKSLSESLFSDYEGVVKSLGAWGGDLVMASRTADGKDYFRSKGFNEIISYREIIHQENNT